MKNEVFFSKVDTPKQGEMVLSNCTIEYFITCDPEKEVFGEDSLFIKYNTKTLLCAISDGAGGHPCGELASENVMKVLKSTRLSSLKEYKVLNKFKQMNESVRSLNQDSKCTLSLITITDDILNCFSVGDSEILVLNDRNEILYSNIPDSPTSYKVEAGIIDQESSLDDPERHLVTNFMGDEYVRIETTSSIKLGKNFTVIVGSDGIFDNFSHAELIKLLRQNSRRDFVKYLVQKCSLQNSDVWRKNDDVSFVVVFY